MSKLWLGTAVLFIAVVGSTARADVMASPPVVTINDLVTATNVETTTTVTLRSVAGGTFLLDSAASCTADFSFTPDSVTIAAGDMQPITVGYKAATVTGTPSCVITVAGMTPSMGSATITVNGTGSGPQLDVAPTLALGDVRVKGAATATANLVLTNAGTSTLTVTSATVTAGDFVLDPTPFPAAVAAGARLTIPVTFNPTLPGARSATVRITSDDPVSAMPTVMLTGVGTNAVIGVDDVAFGLVNGGGTLSKPITVSNTATAPIGVLTATSASIAGGTWFSFAGGAGCANGATTCTLAGVTAPPTKSIAVKCAPPPGAAGMQTATVTFVSDSDLTADTTSALSCTAGAPVATPNPTSLAFANVEVGKTSAPQMVVVSNTGNAPLTISNAALGGALSGSYAVPTGTTGAQTTVLTPGMSTLWSIVCSPQAQGALPASFIVTSDTNAVPTSTTIIPLTCTGQRGVLVVAPTTWDFGRLAAGETATHTFVLSNTGNVAVNTITATLSSTTVGYSITTPTFPLMSLGAQSSVTVTVRFAPLAGTDGGDATITFAGGWGITPTATTAALTVTGDGLTAGFDVTPSTVAFGDVRFDTAPIKTFCIVNTGQAPIAIQAISLAPIGATMTGEVKIIDLRRRACGSNSTVPAIAYPIGAPVSVTSMQTVEVRVQVDPADRTGAIAATATVLSDLVVNPTRTTMITATSTTAILATSPGLTVDFGPTDLDAGPATQTVTIKNTGAAAVDLTGFERTANSVFTLTLPTNTSLPGGMQVDIPITFTPTVERPAGQEDSFVLSHNVTGVLGGPSMQMITVKGRGVDRHLELGPPPVFPATFRNPGSKAPIGTVTVTNTGDADLVVSAVMVTNAEVWQLQETGPLTIPGRMTHDFPVKFVPTLAGKAPVGQLVIMNNDNTTTETPMAIMLLDGDGLDRRVALLGSPIKLGLTGIGLPLTSDGALVIASMDPEHSFVIRGVELVDDTGQFAIDDLPDDMELPPSTALAFDVSFTPTREGDFTARAKLYLDEDPTAAAEVEIQAKAVFVDASGGGGCSTSSGGSAGMMLVIGVVLAARRWRAKALLVAVAVIAPGIAGAEPTDLDLALFDPTPTTVGTTLQVQTPDVGNDGAWVATATVSNASNPLVLNFGGREHASISRRTTIEVGGAYAFLDRFEVGLRLPLYNQAGDDNALGLEPPTGTAVGDLVVHGRARLLETRGENRMLVGASLAVMFPTASADKFAGVDKPSGRVLGLVQFTPGVLERRLTLLGNAGAVIRAKTEFSNIAQGSGFAFGGAASVRVLDPVWVFGEVYGDVLPRARKDSVMERASTMTPIEWLAGVSVRPDPSVAIGVAAGRGLVASIGTPDLRAVLSVAFTPGRERAAPIHPPKPAPLDGDADGDGVRDSVDACADEAEDMDGFQDGDGCPDPDDDGDDVPDTTDKCPTEAEDKDGFQDDDGCPDLDNDGDGIPDARDTCPLEAEDIDGVEDTDGCPDKDNDHDGIDDPNDKCPTQAETINGNADDDGCPDKGDTSVVLTPSSIEMLAPIVFTGVKLAKASNTVLGQVGATMRAHPEIVRVRVTVHVDPTSHADKDQQLTDARATAIREWLITWGLDSKRVSAVGFGGTKPLVTGKKAPINDRVEIIILEKK